jgi:hypothetical protein
LTVTWTVGPPGTLLGLGAVWALGATQAVHIEADPAVPLTRSTVRTLDEVLRRILAAVGAAEVVDAVASQL